MRKLLKLITLLLLLGPLGSFAQNAKQVITLTVKNQPLKEVFRAIQAQTGLNIVVTEKILSGAKKVSLDVKNMPLEEVLDRCFKNTDLTYTIEEGTIVVKKKVTVEKSSQPAKSGEVQSIVVQGRVTNKQGQPLVGATVQVKGSNIAVTAEENGRYNFIVDEDEQLVFSFVDYKPQTVKIKGRSVIDMVLEPKDQALEVVTISTGYQRIEQKYLTGAVTSLKMDSIFQPGLSTIDKMLEGRVPGMIYMQNSGQAGAVPKIRIRGTSTFLGTQEPLWVVDGIVQTDPVNLPASRINDLDFVNLVGNAISGLNPNDIEQIDVLKDAAATALYGVRAANGVIVITTKRGKPGPPIVNYSGTLTYTRRPRYTDKEVYMMNSRERVDASREIIEKQLPLFGNPEGYEKAILDYYNGTIDYDTYMQRVARAETLNTDWFKAVTKDAVSSNHTLGISGGSQMTRYYASMGYTNEAGVIKGEYNKRYTGRIEFDVFYKNFKAEFTISANKTDRRYTPESIGILNYAYSTNRAIPLYNEDGSLYYYSTVNSSTNNTFTRRTFNVLNEMDRSGQTANGSFYTASANLTYQMIPGLQLNAVLSYTAGNTDERTWFEEKTNRNDEIRGDFAGQPLNDVMPFGGELQQSNNRQNNYTVRAQANFSRFIDANQKHQVNATVGTEISSSKNSSIAQVRRGYYPERGFTFANIDLSVYKSYSAWLQRYGQAVIGEGLMNLVSGYMNASYIYDDRFIIGASTRSDFSNAFGSRSNERFLPTVSLSGRWNMHNDIFKDLKWVNLAALRISYGIQGNMLPNQTPYTIIDKTGFNSRYQGFGATIVAYPNPNLKWEKTDSYNAGIDFSLFNNRINGTVSWFYKKTTNAFLPKKVSLMNGTGQYIVNGGILENRGIELAFNFTPINNMGSNGNRKGFVWRIDPQLGQVFNKLLNSSVNPTSNILFDSRNITYTDYLSGKVPIDGKSINTFFSYRFKGLDNNGIPVFYGSEPEHAADLNDRYKKMSKEDIFELLMVESGRREPVVQGGVSNYFGYRNWTLNFTFTYSLGNKIRLLKIASGEYGTYRPSSQQNLRKEFVNRWRYPGDELHTNIPGVSGSTINPWWMSGIGYDGPLFAENYYQMYDASDIRVVKGDYLKLQSLDLSYNFTPAICSKLNMKAARLSLAGTNLFTIADKDLRGQDPTQSGSSPGITLSLRPVYTFNVYVSF